MVEVTASPLQFPRRAGIAQQLFFRDRLSRCLRQFLNPFSVVGQARQFAFRKPTFVAPLLDRRWPAIEPFRDRCQPNKSNRACHTAHGCESVHRKWKVSRDLKCKGCGANSAGDGRHPYNDFLGTTAGSQPRCWLALRPFRYRARARCLAQRCAKVAGRRRLTSAEKSQHAGYQSWCQYRMAEDWARQAVR